VVLIDVTNVPRTIKGERGLDSGTFVSLPQRRSLGPAMDPGLVRAACKLKQVDSFEQLTNEQLRDLRKDFMSSLYPDIVETYGEFEQKGPFHVSAQPSSNNSVLSRQKSEFEQKGPFHVSAQPSSNNSVLSRQKRSVIWEAFTRLFPNFISCDLCFQRFSCANNLWSHLYHKHRNVHDGLRKKQNFATGTVKCDVVSTRPAEQEGEKESTKPNCIVVRLREGDLVAGSSIVIVVTGNQEEVPQI
jgi:hypothetical protein